MDHPIASRRAKSEVLTRDALGRKQCKTCEDWIPVEGYHGSTTSFDGLGVSCKECVRFKKFNLTRREFWAIWDMQGGACGICGFRPETYSELQVDHDHRCCPEQRSCGKCVRGLLCGGCNSGLGYMKESVRTLRSAIGYIERWSAINE